MSWQPLLSSLHLIYTLPLLPDLGSIMIWCVYAAGRCRLICTSHFMHPTCLVKHPEAIKCLMYKSFSGHVSKEHIASAWLFSLFTFYIYGVLENNCLLQSFSTLRSSWDEALAQFKQSDQTITQAYEKKKRGRDAKDVWTNLGYFWSPEFKNGIHFAKLALVLGVWHSLSEQSASQGLGRLIAAARECTCKGECDSKDLCSVIPNVKHLY